MSRVPGFMLTHTVTIERLEGTGPRGATFAAPVTRNAHAEERSALRIDERTTSDTAGTEIVMNTLVITQLEDHCPPGTRITFGGTVLTVANSRRYEHKHAPSNAEMWCV